MLLEIWVMSVTMFIITYIIGQGNISKKLLCIVFFQ